MLVKKFGFNFLLGSFSENLLFLKKVLKKKGSLIVLPTSLNDLRQREKINSFYDEVDIATTDGMPFVFLFRFLKTWNSWKVKRIERTYGPDLMSTILLEDKKYCHFFYGTNKENISSLVSLLKKKNPNLKIVGNISPAFKSAEDLLPEVLEVIKRTKAEVLWIGLSSPKQVQLAALIKKNHPNIKIFCVGAAFDFLSGNKKQAPLWMRKLGLEWFFRFLTEPKRLWRRYLLEIPAFLLKKLFKFIF